MDVDFELRHLDPFGVKEGPLDSRESPARKGFAHTAPARRPAVQVVADDRMTVRGEVDADLVRSAGLGGELEIGHGGQSGHGAVAGDGRLAVALNPHSPSVLGVAPQGIAVGSLSRRGAAPDERAVRLLDAPVLKGERQGPVRLGGSREQDHSGSSDIEPVHQAERGIGRFSAGLEQSTHGFLRRAGSGSRQGDPRRFVHGDEVRTLEEHDRGLSLRSGEGQMRSKLSRRGLFAIAGGAPFLSPRPAAGRAPGSAGSSRPESALPPIDAERLAQRVVRTLAPSAGERAILVFDPGYYPDLAAAIER